MTRINMTPKESLHLVSRFTDILSSKCLNSPLTDRVKNLILLLPRLNESLPAIHMVQPCDDLLLKLFGHIARCILDPNFSSLDQKDSSQLYQLIQLGDQTRKKYGSFSKPVNDGSKSSADMAFVGREFTYLLVLLKHQWQHPIVKYMLLGSGQGNIDTAAAHKYLDQQEPTVLLQLRIDLLTEHKRYNEARAVCEVCLRQKHITENAKFNAEYIILMAKTGKKQGLLDHCDTISCCTGLRVISELYKKSADMSTTLLPVTQSFMLSQWLYASYSDCTQNLLCEWLKVQKICDDDVRRYQFSIINVVEMHQYSSQILELIMAMDRQFPGEYRQMQLGLCLYIGNMENQHVLWAESTKNTEAENYTHTIHYQLTRVCAHLAKRLSSMLLRISLITSFELQPSANLVDELHTCYKLDPHKSVARIELHKLETKGMIKRLIKEIAILFDRIRPLKINTDLPWNDLSTELNKTLEDYLQRRTEQNITAACVAHHNAKQTANQQAANQKKAKSSPTNKQVANQHVANKQAVNQQAANQHAPSQQTAMPRASSKLLANKQHPTNVNNTISSTTHKNLAQAQNPVQPQHMHTTTQIPANNNAQVLSTAQPVRPPMPGDSHNKPLNLSQNVTKSIQAQKIVNQVTQQSRCKVPPPILPPKVQTSASLQSTNVSHPAQSVATNVQSVSAQGHAAHNRAHVKPQHNVIKGQPVPPPKNRRMPVAPPNNGPVHVTYGALTISGKDVRNASSSPMPVQDVNVGHAQSSTKNAKKGGKMGKVNAHTKPNISPNKVSKRKVVKLPKLPKLDDKSRSVVHGVTQGCNVIKQENTTNNSSTRSIDSFQAAYVATMAAQPTIQQSSVKTGRTFKNYKSIVGNSDGIETSGQKAAPKKSNQLVKCQDAIVVCAEDGKGGRGGMAGGSRAGASPASMEIPETYISVNRQHITLDKSHTANVNNQNQRSAKQLAKSKHLGIPFEHLSSYRSPVEQTSKVQRVLGSKVSVRKGITNSEPIVVGEVAVGGGGGEGVRFNDKLVNCDNGSCDEVLSIENLSTYGQVLADPANCQKHHSLVKNVDMKLDEESVANTELGTNESSKAKCLEKIYQDMVNKRLNRDIEMISKGIVVKKKDDYTLGKVVNQTLQGSNSIPFKTQQHIYNTLTSLGKRKITSPVTVNNMVQSAPSTAKRKKIEGIVMEQHSNTNVVPINQLSQSTSSSRKVATIARIPDKIVTKQKPDQRASSMSPGGKPGKNTCRMDSKIEKIDQDISVVVMSLQKTLHSIDKASGSPSASSAQNGMSSAQILATSTVPSTHSGLSTMLHTHVPNLAAATNNASIVSQKLISQPVNGAVLPSTTKEHAGTAHPSVHVPERSPVESGDKMKSILKALPSAPCAEALMKIEGTIITNSKCKTPKKTAANDVRKSKLKVQGKDSVKDVKAKQLKKTPKKNSQTLRVTRSQVELSSTRE